MLTVVSQPSSWRQGTILDRVLDLTASELIAVAAIIRLWAAAYNKGSRNLRLVTEGPYSLTRNPLYLASLIAAVGIGIGTNNLLVATILCASFLAYYPLVVAGEEAWLAQRFGPAYDDYRSRVPRFVPRLCGYVDADEWIIRPRSFRHALLDALAMLAMIPALQVLDLAHG
ncbi:MAG: isoprenylcysteine carboxylmethyltransferase family protein [Planctomycetes bacterium]|nr:isoprenylcysteine carboxylmethyltransferase family protein [Planctomycetota bacterium]